MEEGDGIACVTAHVGKRWPWRSWSKARGGNRVAMAPSSGTGTGLMSSVWQVWRWLSLVLHAVISHRSLTASFPAVTRNTALGADLQGHSLGPDPRVHLCKLLLLPICEPRLLLLHDCQLLQILLENFLFDSAGKRHL